MNRFDNRRPPRPPPGGGRGGGNGDGSNYHSPRPPPPDTDYEEQQQENPQNEHDDAQIFTGNQLAEIEAVEPLQHPREHFTSQSYYMRAPVIQQSRRIIAPEPPLF
jgi:hypothetical protein